MKSFNMLFFALAAFCLTPVFAQNTPPSLPRIDGPYLLPQTIFVGDQGRLVVPLSQAFMGIEPFVLEIHGEDLMSSGKPRNGAPPNTALINTRGILESISNSSDLSIRRIELERRSLSIRLLVDFVPYTPGTIPFPVFEFYSPEEGFIEALTVSGLQVQIASILDSSQKVLSDPALPMLVPGTNLLVYGTLLLVLLFLFLSIGGSLWGRRHFRELLDLLRRRRHIRMMLGFLRRLRQESCRQKGGNPGYYLSILSGQLREFLSAFTGVNCRSFTAAEFLDLPLDYTSAHELPDGAFMEAWDQNGLNPGEWQLFLSRLFRDWDNQRFSGKGVKMTGFFQALKDAEKFTAALERAEKEISLPGLILGFPVAGSSHLETGGGGA